MVTAIVWARDVPGLAQGGSIGGGGAPWYIWDMLSLWGHQLRKMREVGYFGLGFRGDRHVET